MSLRLFVVTIAAPPTGVIPAKAGTQLTARASGKMDPSFCWDDIEGVA
jgi:hypothetical protein